MYVTLCFEQVHSTCHYGYMLACSLRAKFAWANSFVTLAVELGTEHNVVEY